MDAEALLQGLDGPQREAVTVDAAPLGILAGAGSGKTTVLTRRVAYRVATGAADAPHVLAVTFTRRAAAELRRRLWRLGVRDRVVAGTFHGVAWAALRQRAADQARPAPTLVAERSRLVATVLGERRGRGPSVPEVTGEIDWAKARGISPVQYPAEAARLGRHPAAGVLAVADRFAAYEEARRRARSLDFDDLLAVCTEAMATDRRFGDAQRWRFRHLFVDEFQDVSPRQFALLQAWRGEGDDVCVVGDPHQAIYAWNGAEPSYLRDLGTHLGGATVVRLRTNYRSTPQVLAAAEAVLATATAARRRRGDDKPVAFAAAVPAGADGPVPRVHAYADEQAEAAGIAALLDQLRAPGARWSSAAVLVRTHAQLHPVERALEDAGIPARRRGPRLGEHSAVRALLDDRLAAGASTRLDDLADDLVGRLAPTPVPGSDEPPEVTPEPPPPTVPDDERRALEELLEVVRDELGSDARATVASLRAALAGADQGDGASGRRVDGVDLVTFHAAKGLEWPTVVVAGVEDGFVPLAGAARGPARDEEARLLYVALTRARRQLVVTWAQRRHRGLELVARAPSPWLAAVEAVCADLARPADPRVVAELLAEAARAVAAPAEPDPLTALRAWRARTARGARVADVAVCPDDVLAAIARRRPTDTGALAAVPGVGRVLARRHGPALLAALAATSP